MDTKKYHIDGGPVSWTELIDRAMDAGCKALDGLQTTSCSAAYLRECGHQVGLVSELSDADPAPAASESESET